MCTASFPALIQNFFGYLRTDQEVSPHTVAAYRDTFRLLLRFLSAKHNIPIDHLTLEVLSADTVLDFLTYLETRRHNQARTRNARLAAIRAFVRFALGHTAPDFVADAQRILAIPCKRTTKPVLGFLQREEVDAIIAAVDVSTWAGQRDQLLFSLLYNTGARISEALQLKPSDISHRVVRLHGKGRKERDVPLWPQTHRALRHWFRSNQIEPAHPLFTNRDGQVLTRRSASRSLGRAVSKADGACPSLKSKKVTLHTFRHTTAMHLLQAGVPLEVIALWLGHEQVTTTHGYIEADLGLKQAALKNLQPLRWRRSRNSSASHMIAFLEAL